VATNGQTTRAAQARTDVARAATWAAFATIDWPTSPLLAAWH
jgi:hypothetical protein